MMSDHAAQTYEQGEGLGPVFCDTNANASSHPCMVKGMAHCIQACRSSSSEGCENHSAALVGNEVDQFKEHDFFAVERVKFEEVKLLSLDLNKRYTGGYMAKLSSAADNVDLVSHALQSGETNEGGWGNFRITDNCLVKRIVERFDDEITILERISSGSLAESSIKWKASASYHFQNGDANGSEFEHFPMFDINRKIETIMASRKKSTCGARPNDFPCHSSTEEHDNGVKDESSHRWLVGQKRLGQSDNSDMHLWPSKIPKCLMQGVSQPVGSGKGFHKFSGTINSLLVADEIGLDPCHKESMRGGSTMTQVNDTGLSGKFVTPTDPNFGEKEITTVPIGNFTSVENRRGPGGIGIRLVGADNESFTKADTVYHSPRRSSSLPGKTFFRPPMCVPSSNLRKSNRKSATPASIETKTADRVEQASSIKRIEDVSSSSNLVKAYNRWVKRLQHNHSETLSLFSKRFNEYKKLSHDVNGCMEEHKFEKTETFSEKDSHSLGDTEEALQSWIRRWGCKHNQTSPVAVRPVALVAFQPSKHFEGRKFVSITAMALMGKATNSYKPCRIRRKEASLVWST